MYFVEYEIPCLLKGVCIVQQSEKANAHGFYGKLKYCPGSLLGEISSTEAIAQAYHSSDRHLAIIWGL